MATTLQQQHLSPFLLSKIKEIQDTFYGEEYTPAVRAKVWQTIAREILISEKDFEVHLAVYQHIFGNDVAPAAWIPSNQDLNTSNIALLMKELNLSSYNTLHQWASQHRNLFWEKAIEKVGVIFHQQYTTVLDDSKGAEEAIWLPNALLNITDSCFKANPDKIAVITASEGTEMKHVTYKELLSLVNQVANGFLRLGFKAGDRIALYMPLSLEAVALYLGMIRAGLVAVSVADSFSPIELEKRLKMINAKALCAPDGYMYGGKFLSIYDKIKAADVPTAILVSSNPDLNMRSQDVLFSQLIEGASEHFESVKSEPYGLTNILFSSGTTKEPKAIPWTHLTPIKCASDAYFHHDITPQDVITWNTSMGWMMGPWVIYAALMNEATLALFVGSSAGEEFAEFAQEAGITIMGTIPSLVKVWRKNHCVEKFQWKIRLFSSTGEPSNPEDYLYLMSLAGYKAPIIEYCGGTEIGGAYITATVVQPSSPSTFTTPTLGMDFQLLDEENQVVQTGETGQVYIVPPSIGLSQSLLNKNHHEEYFSGCPKGKNGETLRRHGDAFLETRQLFDESRLFRSSGRIDDAMNIGGIKVSAVEIEDFVNQHDDVFESAAIAVQEEQGGPEKLIIYFVPKKEIQDLRMLLKDLQKILSQQLNPLFKIAEIIPRKELPRTASNKIMRRELRKEYLDTLK